MIVERTSALTFVTGLIVQKVIHLMVTPRKDQMVVELDVAGFVVASNESDDIEKRKGLNNYFDSWDEFIFECGYTPRGRGRPVE